MKKEISLYNKTLTPIENAKENIKQIKIWLKSPMNRCLMPNLPADLLHWELELRRLSK